MLPTPCTFRTGRGWAASTPLGCGEREIVEGWRRVSSVWGVVGCGEVPTRLGAACCHTNACRGAQRRTNRGPDKEVAAGAVANAAIGNLRDNAAAGCQLQVRTDLPQPKMDRLLLEGVGEAVGEGDWRRKRGAWERESEGREGGSSMQMEKGCAPLEVAPQALRRRMGASDKTLHGWPVQWEPPSSPAAAPQPVNTQEQQRKPVLAAHRGGAREPRCAGRIAPGHPTPATTCRPWRDPAGGRQRLPPPSPRRTGRCTPPGLDIVVCVWARRAVRDPTPRRRPGMPLPGPGGTRPREIAPWRGAARGCAQQARTAPPPHPSSPRRCCCAPLKCSSRRCRAPPGRTAASGR